MSALVASILLFVIMCIWMGYAVLKHNEDHEAEYDHGDSKHHIAVAMGISALATAIFPRRARISAARSG